eukprot:CAMPEP_0115378374 /NCGR_PEP_ID=MMETSP0271-20121206/3982_1 /TAXON_ID=71861 /ORGANISM="Scrippsiella trochoidea, Strain CCMP3099" /LENGTH=173 /DNA_ID=CAMNT_0002801541 /DNA_START=506 /DNA_END=1025 /DNA_ORIENTATION=-
MVVALSHLHSDDQQRRLPACRAGLAKGWVSAQARKPADTERLARIRYDEEELDFRMLEDVLEAEDELVPGPLRDQKHLRRHHLHEARGIAFRGDDGTPAASIVAKTQNGERLMNSSCVSVRSGVNFNLFSEASAGLPMCSRNTSNSVMSNFGSPTDPALPLQLSPTADMECNK